MNKLSERQVGQCKTEKCVQLTCSKQNNNPQAFPQTRTNIRPLHRINSKCVIEWDLYRTVKKQNIFSYIYEQQQNAGVRNGQDDIKAKCSEWLRCLTLCAESRTGGELGNIYDFDSKLLPCFSVYASSHHTEGTPKHMKKQQKQKQLIWFIEPVLQIVMFNIQQLNFCPHHGACLRGNLETTHYYSIVNMVNLLANSSLFTHSAVKEHHQHFCLAFLSLS